MFTAMEQMCILKPALTDISRILRRNPFLSQDLSQDRSGVGTAILCCLLKELLRVTIRDEGDLLMLAGLWVHDGTAIVSYGKDVQHRERLPEVPADLTGSRVGSW